MSTKEFTMKRPRIYAVGNPLIDIIERVSFEFLAETGAERGSMNLVDSPEQRVTPPNTKGGTRTAGGSAANTARAIAWVAGETIETVYCGAVGNDSAADELHDELVRAGVVPKLAKKPTVTGSSVVFVTPDHERTMFTHLGASRSLSIDDLDLAFLSNSSCFHTTGYMWDTPNQEAAVRGAATAAKAAGTAVSFDVADPFVATRYRDSLLEWIPTSVEILFANESELRTLLGALEKPVEEVAKRAAELAPLVIMKRGKDGAVVILNGTSQSVPAVSITAIDTTGAGDAFAGGFLSEWAAGRDPVTAARFANLLAAQICTVEGCRFDRLDRKKFQRT